MDSVLSIPYSIRSPNRSKSTDNLEVSVKGIWYGVILVTLIATASCAGRRSDVVIDPAGVDMGLYQKDLAECQEISKQVRGKAAGGAVGGIVGNSDTAAKARASGR
jgi:hypothetical protein